MLGVLHVFSHLIFKITLWDQGYNLYLQMSVCAAKETQILFGIHSFTHSLSKHIPGAKYTKKHSPSVTGNSVPQRQPTGFEDNSNS